MSRPVLINNAGPRWLQGLLRVAAGVFAAAVICSAVVATGLCARETLSLDLRAWTGAVVWLGLAVWMLRAAARPADGASDRAYLLAGTLLLAGAKGLLIVLASGYTQAADCAYFQDAMRLMLARGLGLDVQQELARIYYDDYLWMGRAWPLLYPLGRLFPDQFVLAGLLANVAVSAAHNLVVYALARRLATRVTARVAFALMTLFPLHFWQVLDYTHQYLGALLVMSAAWFLLRLFDVATTGRGRIGAAAGFLVMLGLVRLQSGIDLFLLAATGLMGMLGLLLPASRSATLRALPLLAFGIVVFYLPVARLTSQWLARTADLRMSSHPVSFTARGWNVMTWGEYYGVYEQVDRETPRPEKAATMAGLVLSQMAGDPVRTLVVLPWVKLTKFYLVGYATNTEAQLQAAGHEALASAARGTRRVFAPVFLLLVAIGATGWGRTAGGRADLWFVGLLPLLFGAIYLLCGETSPRYSFHVHGALAIVAAAGWSALADRRETESWLGRAGTVVLGAAAFSALLGVLALGLPGLIRAFAGEKWVHRLGGTPARSMTAGHPALNAFETFIPVGGSFARELNLPEGHDQLSLIVWPELSEALWPVTSLRVLLAGQTVTNIPMQPTRPGSFFAVAIPTSLRGNRNATFELTVPADEGGRSARPLDGIRVGYVRTYRGKGGGPSGAK